MGEEGERLDRNPGIRGRDREIELLSGALREIKGARVLTLTGPRGGGKTSLIREVLANERLPGRGRGIDVDVVHFHAAPLTADDLLVDLAELSRRILGELPSPRRSRVIPLGSGEGSWSTFLSGLTDHVERSGRRTILVLDGVGDLHESRRRLPGELGEMIHRARSRELPMTLLLSARSDSELAPFTGPSGAIGVADAEVDLPSLPYRVAGWGHGGVDSLDAFQRWALLGDHPGHLPVSPPREELEETILRRILLSDGDLFDAPLRRLEAAFQRPGRYAAILRALSGGALDWADLLGRAKGIDSGGQLSPYLRKLEEEGLVRAETPLDARAGSRGKRYSLVDPFFAFWFRWVLPLRSLLSPQTARDLWRTEIRPGLSGHFQLQLEEAARRWLRDHATEVFGVGAREAGALWGEDADFAVAGLLSNGQVCHGIVEWSAGADDDLSGRMRSLMQRTRYGIGREAKFSVFFLAREEKETVRRIVARDPLARVVDLPQLMGTDPPDRLSSA